MTYIDWKAMLDEAEQYQQVVNACSQAVNEILALHDGDLTGPYYEREPPFEDYEFAWE